eukprot:CAMPEP_0119390470 /NCGR_PEP_ID=MMETSP1334-20130426/113492_1 /TAXON_ID=127549 /ORGANISM="Calcidiscus leptoporus, Strain RCC1130" /LENGTH=261 /DNA_ID=CAMNT_0007412973 /DNA_START=150 /DNA_END=936 /DNA_ORIENTATION=+
MKYALPDSAHFRKWARLKILGAKSVHKLDLPSSTSRILRRVARPPHTIDDDWLAPFSCDWRHRRRLQLCEASCKPLDNRGIVRSDVLVLARIGGHVEEASGLDTLREVDAAWLAAELTRERVPHRRGVDSRRRVPAGFLLWVNRAELQQLPVAQDEGIAVDLVRAAAIGNEGDSRLEVAARDSRHAQPSSVEQMAEGLARVREGGARERRGAQLQAAFGRKQLRRERVVACRKVAGAVREVGGGRERLANGSAVGVHGAEL